MFQSGMSQLEIRQALVNGEARLPGTKSKGRNGSAKKKKRNNEEEQLQCGCNSWNKLNSKKYPLLEWMFHSPNGGGRSKAESGILKAMGVKPGVPDFILPFPSEGGYQGLAIELKSEIGRLSDDQRAWLRHAYQQGWCVSVVRTLEQHMDVVKEFMNGIPARLKQDRPVKYGAKEIFEEV